MHCQHKAMRTDARGQATGFIVFALMIALAALLWGILDPAASEIFDLALASTSDQQAQDVIKERQQIWNNLLFFIVALAGIFLLARAAFQSRAG